MDTEHFALEVGFLSEVSGVSLRSIFRETVLFGHKTVNHINQRAFLELSSY